MINMGCCTGPTCTIRADNFNRPDEVFTTVDSTGNWSDIGTPKYEIVSDKLSITCAGESGTVFQPILQTRNLPHDAHYALRVSWDVKMPDVDGSRLRIMLSISPPNTHSIDFLEAFLELDPGAADGSTCGSMRFVGVEPDGTLTLIGDVVQLPGFIAEQWYRVRFCLDWDLDMAIGSVAPIGDTESETFGHHVKDVPHVISNAGSNGPLFNITSQLWVNRNITGTYQFDNFKLEALREQSQYYYYYYYGDDNCPTCKSHKDPCETTTITFTIDEDGNSICDDCRWTPNETNGGCLKAGWSGLDSNGLEDNTTSAVLTYHVPEGGGALTMSLGDFSASITIDADGNGVLTFGDQTQDFTVNPDPTVDQSLRLCCFDGTIFVSTTGDPLVLEAGAVCDDEACVTDNTLELVNLSISHNLSESECDSCFSPGTFPSPCTGTPLDCETAIDAPPLQQNPPACADNIFPKHAIFRATPQQGSNCLKCQDYFRGVFIADLDETFEFHSSCVRFCDFPVGLLGTQVCDAYYDTGFAFTFDISEEPNLDPSCPCVNLTGGFARIGWRFIAHLYLDEDCNYRMIGVITEFTQSLGIENCCSYIFRSGVLGDVMNPPACPGLRVLLAYEDCVCGDDPPGFCDFDAPSQNNCDFRGSELEVTLT